MTTTPENATPDEHDDAQEESTSTADPTEEGGAGVEIGMTEGEGSTFEPEEDPEAQT